jgi:hypothetical protein
LELGDDELNERHDEELDQVEDAGQQQDERNPALFARSLLGDRRPRERSDGHG